MAVMYCGRCGRPNPDSSRYCSNCGAPLTRANTGSFSAVLSGTASLAAENFAGTFTINWPGGSLNPSNGTLTVTEANGLETVSGSVTSGFDTGSAFATQYVITGQTGRGTALHPVTAQTYTNTQPLTLARNEG